MTPIQELAAQRQSLWYDNIRRQVISSGELARLRDGGVTGVTSNPTIFEKAVSGSNDYDQGLVRMVQAGAKADQILWGLMVEDIQAAADVFAPVHERTAGADGYVSIEVSPALANDTRGTIAMARDLRDRCCRPNVMVKIPATRAGLPAIRTMIGEGTNINVTLTFSVDRYAEVVESFLAGLEDLRARGGDVSKVASVASFFVSRVDTKVDRILDATIAAADARDRKRLESLRGRAAIANSKLAYQKYLELFAGDRWEALAEAGARPQRCLWASTSTKDPRYPDTMYVEELIGPNTVNTVPPDTLRAFADHGEVRRSLDENVDLARRQLEQLAQAQVDLDRVTAELEVEGVASFAKSFEDLLKAIKDQARAIRAGNGPRLWHQLGEYQPGVDAAVARLQKEDVPSRLWKRDPTLWVPESRGQAVRDRLGWLDIVGPMLEQRARFEEVAKKGRSYRDVVILGMGGSSLCPDVLRATFGRVKSHPSLHVLDTTDPATIVHLRKRLDLKETLFIVASKSGETLETLSHFAYFWEEVSRKLRSGKAGRHFAAITDAGSGLERLALAHDFRWVFQNPPDIGGRYSALSYFGLVPAALMGLDVVKLLERASEMAVACGADVPVEKNPGIWLGAVLGQLAELGRNKLTLVMSPAVATFGCWVEQLVAESTGKQGRGIVPVEGEPLGAPECYGDDRLFVYTRMDDEPENPAVTALERAGQPVVTLPLRDRFDLGAEFLRWEVATAVAGSLIGIDAFDQPNVQESKENTATVLADFESTGRMAAPVALSPEVAGPRIAELLSKARPDSYFAIMSYTEHTGASDRAMARIRTAVRSSRRLATTAGYGPRFLHSTGQLHKGGPIRGIFLQVVQEDDVDLPIPAQPYGFQTLRAAQALGDLTSLRSRRLPVLQVRLGAGSGDWKVLAESLEKELNK